SCCWWPWATAPSASASCAAGSAASAKRCWPRPWSGSNRTASCSASSSRRRRRLDDALHEAVLFEPDQGLGQHLFADAADPAAQLAEALGAVAQGHQQQD